MANALCGVCVFACEWERALNQPTAFVLNNFFINSILQEHKTLRTHTPYTHASKHANSHMYEVWLNG